MSHLKRREERTQVAKHLKFVIFAIRTIEQKTQ